jgi:hypothetical protein
MDLAFSCLVWSCEASGKAQTSIESLPEICCFADVDFIVYCTVGQFYCIENKKGHNMTETLENICIAQWN